MGTVKTWDRSLASIIIGGSIIKSWKKVVISSGSDKWTFTSGAGGELTRTKNSGSIDSIKLVLPQTSVDNAMMTAFEISGSLIPCLFVDKGGTSLHTMPEGTVVKIPDAEYSDDPSDREWTVTGQFIEPNIVGGNN